MIVNHEDKIEGAVFNNPEAKGASMKALISPKEGWEGYVMRVLELTEGGYSPQHSHPWPHINYILGGQGVIFIDGVETPVKEGSYAYIPDNALHQFKNVGEGIFKFMCIVPEEGHK